MRTVQDNAVAYAKQWNNPRPDAEIESVDMVYSMTAGRTGPAGAHGGPSKMIRRVVLTHASLPPSARNAWGETPTCNCTLHPGVCCQTGSA